MIRSGGNFVPLGLGGLLGWVLIICEAASQSVNLTYSVIKFLRFDHFAWEGESLPLWLSPLGDLHALSLDLQDERGVRQRDARWEEGALYGDFLKHHSYSLSMRLEFQPPFRLDHFATDFQSIHPLRYLVALDFPKNRAEEILEFQLGEQAWRIPLAKPLHTELEDGTSISLSEDLETFSFQVRKQTTVPFSHGAFPVFRLPDPRRS